MKIHKRMAALVLALTLCFGFTATAYAHDVPDMDRTGSISARMLYDGKTVGGGSMVLYRVGDISEDNGNYSFTLTDGFAASGASLANISDPALAKSLADYAKANNLSGTPVVIGDDGTVKVQSLRLGLYLVVQDKVADGFEAVSPFLVSVPMFENGSYVYDVNAEPKLSALTKTPVTGSGNVRRRFFRRRILIRFRLFRGNRNASPDRTAELAYSGTVCRGPVSVFPGLDAALQQTEEGL